MFDYMKTFQNTYHKYKSEKKTYDYGSVKSIAVTIDKALHTYLALYNKMTGKPVEQEYEFVVNISPTEYNELFTSWYCILQANIYLFGEYITGNDFNKEVDFITQSSYDNYLQIKAVEASRGSKIVDLLESIHSDTIKCKPVYDRLIELEKQGYDISPITVKRPREVWYSINRMTANLRVLQEIDVLADLKNQERFNTMDDVEIASLELQKAAKDFSKNLSSNITNGLDQIYNKIENFNTKYGDHWAVKAAKRLGRGFKYLSEYYNCDLEYLYEEKRNLDFALSDFDGDRNSPEFEEYEREIRERKTAVQQAISYQKKQQER